MDTLWFVMFIFVVITVMLIYHDYRQPSVDKREIIRVLVRQATRWTLAAKQDKELIIAVLHANYGAGYLWALRDIATDDEIQQSTNVDILRLRDEIISVQDSVTRRLMNTCSDIAPKNNYIHHVATTI